MLPEYITLLTLPISILFTIKYIIAAFQNQIQPNIVSWSVWSVSSLLSFSAAFSLGSDFLQIFSTFTAGFFPLLTVLSLIIIHKGKFKLSKLDFICIILALVGLVFWKTLGNPIFAYSAGLLADMIGFLPTILKTIKNPKSEDYKIYLIGVGNVIIQLLVLKSFSIYTLGFPIYVLIFNSLVVGVILIDKHRSVN
jgi:hypothetical protein